MLVEWCIWACGFACGFIVACVSWLYHDRT